MSHITTEQADSWHRIATMFRTATESLEQARLELLTQLEVTEGRPLQEIERGLNALSGNAYMFTPQSEWLGGDSSDPKNFKFRPPHITKSSPLTRCDKCGKDTGICTTCPDCVCPTKPV